MKPAALRVGVAGLGRAFTLMLPTFVRDPRVRLVAPADPIAAARERFQSDFGATAYASVEALCASPDVQVVYVATPHQLHARHVGMAAAAGKHILVEKPMAISVDECTQMIEAARAANVHLIVGPSHSFDRPILRVREIVEAGTYGRVRMITALDFTDFLYRPRRPEELDTQAGGGVVHSQAAHQMDIVRLLGGGLVRRVSAYTGAWDPERPTEGAYSVLLGFDGGAFCSATYSGYAHYDSDVLMDGIAESGRPKPGDAYGQARRHLAQAGSLAEETGLKQASNYGGSGYRPMEPTQMAWHRHFGPIIISCDRADLRPTAKGVEICADLQRHFEPLAPPVVPRSEVIDELHAAVTLDIPPVHSGEWARATTEVCFGILESARTGRDYFPRYQVGA